MTFLQVEVWTGFATWVQAITGIAALILALISILQSKKIKELSDIVAELQRNTEELSLIAIEQQKQTKTLSDRYQLELLVSLPDRMPFFKHEDVRLKIGYITVALRNIGIHASTISFNCFDFDLINNVTSESKKADHNDIVQVVFEWTPTEISGQFVFDIIITDMHQNGYVQKAYVNIPDKIVTTITPVLMRTPSGFIDPISDLL